MIEYLTQFAALATSHEGIELLKGTGLVGIIGYVIWSDRSERRDNREAEVKRSEAVKAMAEALKELSFAIIRFKKD